MRATHYLSIPLCLALAAACGKDDAGKPASGGAGDQPPAPKAEVIKIDGSSTVFPITQAVAEEYQKKHGGKLTVGVSGTGGGFKKFCAGEIALTGASRPIKPSELELCSKNNIEYVELPVAYDGLAVVVHKDNDWVDTITVAELKKIWEPEAQGKIMKWSQVRDGWPNAELHLFGAGVDSGTYDYFTAAVNGKEHASRGDFTSSEDDNVLVQGISTDKNALGFFGFAYYAENAEVLKLLAIDPGDGKPVAPSLETVANGTYQPLSRPIFIYINKAALDSRPEVKAFAEFYVGEGTQYVEEVGYIKLPDKAYELVRQRLAKGVTGSVFEGKGSQVGVTVEQLLSAEGS